MIHETQKTISQWAEETFGPASSNARVAARVNEEMAELLRALTVNDNNPKAGEEMADIIIVMSRLAERMGFDLVAEVDKKMAINRERTWARDGSGHGYHHEIAAVDKTERSFVHERCDAFTTLVIGAEAIICTLHLGHAGQHWGDISGGTYQWGGPISVDREQGAQKGDAETAPRQQ